MLKYPNCFFSTHLNFFNFFLVQKMFFTELPKMYTWSSVFYINDFSAQRKAIPRCYSKLILSSSWLMTAAILHMAHGGHTT